MMFTMKSSQIPPGVFASGGVGTLYKVLLYVKMKFLMERPTLATALSKRPKSPDFRRQCAVGMTLRGTAPKKQKHCSIVRALAAFLVRLLGGNREYPSEARQAARDRCGGAVPIAHDFGEDRESH
jgi:hypothetical protein